jgi:hypothetical protein
MFKRPVLVNSSHSFAPHDGKFKLWGRIQRKRRKAKAVKRRLQSRSNFPPFWNIGGGMVVFVSISSP